MNLQAIINQAVVTALPFMEDRVTFKRPAPTTDTAGGHTRSLSNTTPVSIPCVLEVASAAQIATLGDKPIKGTVYRITIPSRYSSVVDVDTTCTAVVAARGVDAERSFKVQGVGRIAGAIIQVLASKEE